MARAEERKEREGKKRDKGVVEWRGREGKGDIERIN